MKYNFFYKLKIFIGNKTGLSRIKWHDLRDIQPVSREFGIDRGKPIDRFYIEHFIHENRNLISGRLLEVGENRYINQFGNKVNSFEILHIEKNKNATLIADLTDVKTLPNGQFDCFICTNVLNFIYDFQKAIEGSHYLLKSGGTMIATVACISKISGYDEERWGHFWSFYPQGILKAFENVFGVGNVTVKTYGNSLSAIAFIKGLAADELTEHELLYKDSDYPVTVSIKATKR